MPHSQQVNAHCTVDHTSHCTVMTNFPLAGPVIRHFPPADFETAFMQTASGPGKNAASLHSQILICIIPFLFFMV